MLKVSNYHALADSPQQEPGVYLVVILVWIRLRAVNREILNVYRRQQQYRGPAPVHGSLKVRR
jgi:hypothetical protein